MNLIKFNFLIVYVVDVCNKDNNNYGFGYETQAMDVECILPFIENEVNIRQQFSILEPFNGGGNISNVLRGIPNVTVQTNDLYEDGSDTKIDVFDLHIDKDVIIVSNPPYKGKNDIIKLLVRSGNPCALLLPTQTMHNVGIQDELSVYLTSTVFISPRPKFMHNGKLEEYVGTNWFMFNWRSVMNPLTFINKKKLNDEVSNADANDDSSVEEYLLSDIIKNQKHKM